MPSRKRSGPLLGKDDCRPIQCVFLTCFENDYEVLNAVLRYSGLRIHRAETLDYADFLLTVTEATILLTDTLFLDGSWMDAVRMCISVHPSISCFVITDPVDFDFVANRIQQGTLGILGKPLRFLGLRRLLESAHEAAVLRKEAAESIVA